MRTQSRPLTHHSLTERPRGSPRRTPTPSSAPACPAARVTRTARAARSAPLSFEAIRSLDERATHLARSESAVRLAFGEALAIFTHRSFHHELGFSNVASYVTEHCDLSPHFASDSVSLADRLERTPCLRQLLVEGQLGWSRADLLTKLVQAGPPNTPDTYPDPKLPANTNAPNTPSTQHAHELAWLAHTQGKTCAELRQQLARLKRSDDANANTPTNADDYAEPASRTLSFTLPERDLWLFQAAELVCQRISGDCPREQFFTNLLAEASTLFVREAPTPAEKERRERVDRWRAQLAAWRLESERRCEAAREPLPNSPLGAHAIVPRDELRTWSAGRLHLHVVTLARKITGHGLKLGGLAQELHRHEVWLRLGFASEEHHARERLGLCMSSLKQKRLLAQRLQHQPEVRRAVLQGLVPFRAAVLITRVATPKNANQWVERARQRTIKNLAEEVAFVERVLARHPRHPAPPPSPKTMRASLAVEGHIKSGRYWLEPESRPTSSEAIVQAYEEHAKTGEPGEPSEPNSARHISGPKNPDETQAEGPLGVRRGHVRLTLRISERTLSFFREVERGFRKARSRAHLVRALLEHFLEVWCPTLVSNREISYEHIYTRDCFRCTSPVCTRHDLTPHHLVYRSRGGGEESDNLASLCVWCHLEGVHGGRIVARPVNGEVHWQIGRVSVTLVHGRERVRTPPNLPRVA